MALAASQPLLPICDSGANPNGSAEDVEHLDLSKWLAFHGLKMTFQATRRDLKPEEMLAFLKMLWFRLRTESSI